jgi:hypothetical protein
MTIFSPDRARSITPLHRSNSPEAEARDQTPRLLKRCGEDVAGRLRSLPPLPGLPIRVEWAPALRTVRGLLLTGGGRGKEVHAASFVRERRIVFDEALRHDAGELSRILVHEVFHFAWVRLSNGARQSWRQLLRCEFARSACGELGWSSECRKSAIRSSTGVTPDRVWSEYACESFCDTAAWIYAGAGEHEEFTLARRFRETRRSWFRSMESHRAAGIRI